MKKIIAILIVVLGLAPNTTLSQDRVFKSRIQFSVGSFHVPEVPKRNGAFYKPFVQHVGLSYSQEISHHFGVILSYSRWFNWYQLESQISDLTVNGFHEMWGDVGDIMQRYNYQFFDAGSSYTVFRNARHEFIGGLGVSFASGNNRVLMEKYQHPGYPDYHFSSEVQKENYFGGFAQVGYNYFLLSRRLNIGASGSVRFYPTVPTQFYGLINVGYNFSWRKQGTK